MSYNLDILVEGGTRIPPMIIEKIRIEVNPRYYGRGDYKDTFSYMAEKRGAWCCLLEIDKGKRIYSAMNIADIDIEIPDSEVSYPFWTDKISGMYVFKIRDEYYHSFKTVMKKLQALSPKKRIMFLPRLEGGEYNNVCGVITMKHFFELLDSRKILFNIVYIIQN
ncbi:hypothetical protein [uncultured Ruminococcus sp.]|uniref:hypothetical protein n=1 Tax=uncultured Ruminococcus sp. TaxID=165186 RepID=UPI00261D8870|nr:hypothetical protein [uncultured Ruminococcus sp.]